MLITYLCLFEGLLEIQSCPMRFFLGFFVFPSQDVCLSKWVSIFLEICAKSASEACFFINSIFNKLISTYMCMLKFELYVFVVQYNIFQWSSSMCYAQSSIMLQHDPSTSCFILHCASQIPSHSFWNDSFDTLSFQRYYQSRLESELEWWLNS